MTLCQRPASGQGREECVSLGCLLRAKRCKWSEQLVFPLQEISKDIYSLFQLTLGNVLCLLRGEKEEVLRSVAILHARARA